MRITDGVEGVSLSRISRPLVESGSLHLSLCAGLVVITTSCVQIRTLMAFDDSPVAFDISAASSEIQRECEKYREEHYQSGEAVVVVRAIADDGSGSERVVEEQKLTLIYDGDRLRNDRVVGDQRFQSAVADGIYSRNWGAATPVVIAPSTEYPDVVSHLGMMHPRWIGMGFNSWGLMSARNRRCLQLASDGKVLPVRSLAEVELEGIPAWKIEYAQSGRISGKSFPTGVVDSSVESESTVPMERVSTLWIVPSQGYALRRCVTKVTYPTQNIEQVSRLESVYALDQESNTWFPSEAHWTMSQNGTIVSGEEIVVLAANFRPRVARDFGIDAFSLQADQRIVDRTQGPREIESFFDGTKAVRIPHPMDVSAPLESSSAQVQRTSLRGWLLLANGIIFGAVAVALILSRWHRGRSS